MGLLAIMLTSPVAHAQYTTYYPTTSYNQSVYNCPADFLFTVQNNVALCYKYVNIGPYVSNPYPSSFTIPYPSSYGTVLDDCRSGQQYSALTGRRCDGDDYYYDNYDNDDEATIRNYDVRDGDDTTLDEGDHDAEIMNVRFDVEDNDIELDRVTVYFEFTGNGSGQDRPWEVFDEINLFSDGKRIETVESDDEDEWVHEYGDTYSIEFDNLDETIRENDRAELTVEVDIASFVDGDDNSWEIFVPDRGIRAESRDGETLYTGDDDESVSVDIEN